MFQFGSDLHVVSMYVKYCLELSLSMSNMHHLQRDCFRDSISLCWHLQQQASGIELWASQGIGEIVSFLASGPVSIHSAAFI